MARTTEEELKLMQEEVARLKKSLGLSEKARSEAEETALAMTQASAFTGNTEEQPTGNTVSIEVCLNPAERDEKKLKYKSVDFPTYFYQIQLPTAAGLDLTTNGIAYYHGQTYELDPMTLNDIKSRVARCWDHEKSIHGDNENAYRKPTNRQLGVPTRQ